MEAWVDTNHPLHLSQVAQNSAMRSHGHLGALPPDLPLPIHTKMKLHSFNTGLTSHNFEVGNKFAYVYTEALLLDLEETFQAPGADGLVLCEMGSQKYNESIDNVLMARSRAPVTRTGSCRFGFVDTSETLQQYLEAALTAGGLQHLRAFCAPPYAFIFDPAKLSVTPPEFFNPLPTNKERRGVRYDVKYLPTGDQFPLVCMHSASSLRWDKLTTDRQLFSKTV